MGFECCSKFEIGREIKMVRNKKITAVVLAGGRGKKNGIRDKQTVFGTGRKSDFVLCSEYI